MKYPMAPLGEVLELDLDQVEVEPFATYPMAGVYSFGRGLFAREPITGAHTRYKKLTRLHEGQFVVSRLKAFEGAVAVVPTHFDGWFLSQEFPTFRVKPAGHPGYLAHICRWPFFWETLAASSKGIGARRERVHPEQLLAIEIPLPDLDEQHRIAATLDNQLDRLSKAAQKTVLANTKRESLWSSYLRETFASLAEHSPVVPLEDAVDLNPETIDPTAEFSDAFLYVDISAVEKRTGRITMPQRLRPYEAPSRARRRIREGDVLVSTVRPNLRGFALVPAALDGAVCSTGFAVLRPRPGLLSEFLAVQVHSEVFLTQLKTRGGHYPAVSDKRLRQVRIVRPDLACQREVVDRARNLLAKGEQLQALAGRRSQRIEDLGLSVLSEAFNGQI